MQRIGKAEKIFSHNGSTVPAVDAPPRLIASNRQRTLPQTLYMHGDTDHSLQRP